MMNPTRDTDPRKRHTRLTGGEDGMSPYNHGSPRKRGGGLTRNEKRQKSRTNYRIPGGYTRIPGGYTRIISIHTTVHVLAVPKTLALLYDKSNEYYTVYRRYCVAVMIEFNAYYIYVSRHRRIVSHVCVRVCVCMRVCVNNATPRQKLRQDLPCALPYFTVWPLA